MSIQLYIIQQSLTKQVHQSMKAIFLAIYVAIPKNDNAVVLIIPHENDQQTLGEHNRRTLYQSPPPASAYPFSEATH